MEVSINPHYLKCVYDSFYRFYRLLLKFELADRTTGAHARTACRCAFRVAVASPNALAEAAQRVATGDMRHAVALLPGIGGQSVLTQAYDSVFRMLLQILVAVTLASALVILGCEAAFEFSTEICCNLMLWKRDS